MTTGRGVTRKLMPLAPDLAERPDPRIRRRGVIGRVLMLSVVVAFSNACTDAGPGQALALAPVATSRAPLSLNESIALASETVACVIDSYEIRVHCAGRDDVPAGVFGRRGEGPGEFEDPFSIVRGFEETVGVIDIESQRLSVFTPAGQLVAEVRLPGFFLPAAPIDASVAGNVMDVARMQWRQVELDVTSSNVLWERVYPTDLREEAGCESLSFRGLLRGVASPGGRMTFATCHGHLIHYSSKDDDAGVLVLAPTYTIELPNERDIRYAEELRRNAAARGGFVPPPPSRERPKGYARHLWFDGHDRLWVLTNRDRDEWSYLDVYDTEGEYAGTVRIRDRAEGFDVLGSTLAALVERRADPDDADGIPDRAIDWYDISGVDLGLRAP